MSFLYTVPRYLSGRIAELCSYENSRQLPHSWNPRKRVGFVRHAGRKKEAVDRINGPSQVMFHRTHTLET